MEYILVSFRSRQSALKFSKILTSNGIFSEVVNTPKEAGVGCGLSVKILPQSFAVVKRAVFSASISSFAGFFLVKTVGGKRFVRSI